MFKYILKIVLVGSVGMITTLAYAEDAKTGCALKAQKIQEQIDYAKAHGNAHRQAGLEKALARLNERCTDDYLREELQAKVTKKQHEVNERQADLAAAQSKGDAKKIAKRQKKLEEAQQELTMAKQELNSYFK